MLDFWGLPQNKINMSPEKGPFLMGRISSTPTINFQVIFASFQGEKISHEPFPLEQKDNAKTSILKNVWRCESRDVVFKLEANEWS